MRLSWDADRHRVTVSPAGHWAAGTFYTITVRAGALGDSGRPMAVPARAVFLTRQATTGRLRRPRWPATRPPSTTGFSFSFDRPVAIGDVRKALSVNPPLRGALDVARSADGSTTFVFTPTDVLQPATDYAVGLEGLRRRRGLADRGCACPQLPDDRRPGGRPLPSEARDCRTSPQTQALSVRFTQPMDRRSTKNAFTVTADGKPVSGKVSFAEKDKVLVFRPDAALPYGAWVEITRHGLRPLGERGAACGRADASGSTSRRSRYPPRRALRPVPRRQPAAATASAAAAGPRSSVLPAA